MSLNYKDFELLLTLHADPFMTITELAKKLKLSRPTTKKKMDILVSDGIIKPATALYKPEPLGLQRVNVFVNTPTIEALEMVEVACKMHPYTHYRARFYGGTYGLFIQFDIPPNTLNRLHEFLVALRKRGFIANFDIYTSTGLRVGAFPDLIKFDCKTSNWNFSWEKWFSSFSEYPTSLDLPELPTEDYSNFQKIHFNILRELTANASIKQKEIQEKFKLSKTEAHRKYTYVRNNYVDKIRLIYNREAFDLTETHIAIGSFVHPKKQARIYNKMKEHPPPFHIALDLMKENHILIWAHMSPAQSSSFAFSIWKYLKNVQIFALSTRFGSSTIYWFYANNFDFNRRRWKTSRKYMVTQPLKELNNINNKNPTL